MKARRVFAGITAAARLLARDLSCASYREDSLGGGSTPPRGTGARPVSESGGISPCAAPPQDVSRPNPYVGHYRITVRDGQPFRIGEDEARS